MTALRILPVFWAAFHFVGAPGKLSGGVARPQSPPMGWRSWNVFQCSVSQEIIEQQMDALMAKRAVDGVQTSLLDLGYSDLGLDDCWQVCDAKGESFHDPDTGMAIINTELFPDMEGMVSYGHMRGLQVGFYVNNCFCHEHGQPTHYAEDANLTVKLGYDSVKIDSCGNQRDMTEWLREFESLGKTLMVESCGNGPPGSQPKHDAIPSTAWLEMINNTCPFSFYRVSDDIAPQFLSTMYNLNRLVPYLGASPLSRPGCWAYPDMLEVGVRLSEAEARTHFAAWCVTSSPLILGFDLADAQQLDAVWPIIANREALRVSQTWAGHPGRLVANSSKYFDAVCEKGASDTHSHPCTFPEWQAWAKPQPGGAVAVLLVNLAEAPVNISVDLAALGLPERAACRDLWAHAECGALVGALSAPAVPPHDGVFVLLTPSAEQAAFPAPLGGQPYSLQRPGQTDYVAWI